MDKDFCNSVLPIPQYQNTCWFTSSLMCILRSQYSRRFLLNNLKINDKSPKVIKMIYKLLMKTYIANPKTYEYYKKFNLHNFIKYFIREKTIINRVIKKGNSVSLFMPLFIKAMGMESLYIQKFDNINELFIGYYEYIYNIQYKNKIPTIEDYKKKVEKEFSKKINPDYIFINILPENKYDNLNNEYLDMCNIDNFKSITYDKNLKELKSFIFNDTYYELDSCIINNYNANITINKKNTKMPAHSIAGIKCKGEKYVYNGWIKSTKDPAMLSRNVNYIPCALIKHDWEVNNKNDEFCLNPIKCKLDNINPADLCFSFSKGIRVLIFVKSQKNYNSIDKNMSNSSSLIYPSNETKKNITKDLKKKPIINKKIDIKNDIKNDDKKFCKEWINNKNVNPETKRKIKDTSPIYKKYMKLCDKIIDIKKDIKTDDKKFCKEWINNKNVNPETKRKIKDTSPIYKKYMKLCDNLNY